jgi:hypothetical protein
MKKRSVKAKAFDEAFDRGERVFAHLVLSKAVRPGQVQRGDAPSRKKHKDGGDSKKK